MGKASKFKKLRRLAKELPGLNRKTIVGERISGKELMGIEKDTAGNTIDSTQTYIKKSPVNIPVNHERNMKNIYNKHGQTGVNGYIKEVENIARNLQNNLKQNP